MTTPRYRLACDLPLQAGAAMTLPEAAAHYFATVLRLSPGDTVALFNARDGEWQARIQESRKRVMVVRLEAQLRPPPASLLQLSACFAPIKGGRLEAMVEKATELGARVLQPVITERTVVTRINRARLEATVREAAEQCERLDWPEIRDPVALPALLGAWPAEVPLLYGDERGAAPSVAAVTRQFAGVPGAWGVLSGPEGGFSEAEFQALARVKAAHGVSLGPRILRADTALTTLCVATLMPWGDWHKGDTLDDVSPMREQ